MAGSRKATVRWAWRCAGRSNNAILRSRTAGWPYGNCREACGVQQGEIHMKWLQAWFALAALCTAPLAWSEEPDHAIHEELRGVLRGVVTAINSGKYDEMLPYLAANVERRASRRR